MLKNIWTTSEYVSNASSCKNTQNNYLATLKFLRGQLQAVRALYSKVLRNLHENSLCHIMWHYSTKEHFLYWGIPIILQFSPADRCQKATFSYGVIWFGIGDNSKERIHERPYAYLEKLERVGFFNKNFVKHKGDFSFHLWLRPLFKSFTTDYKRLQGKTSSYITFWCAVFFCFCSLFYFVSFFDQLCRCNLLFNTHL